MAVFEKVALEITKRAQHCVLPWFIRFHVFWSQWCECTCVQRLGSVQGSFANEWVIKPFLKHPKSSKFVCINSSLQCMYNLNPISLIDFCETFQRIRCVKHFKKKNFRTRLKFDLGLKPLWRHCHVTFIPIAPKIIP